MNQTRNKLTDSSFCVSASRYPLAKGLHISQSLSPWANLNTHIVPTAGERDDRSNIHAHMQNKHLFRSIMLNTCEQLSFEVLTQCPKRKDDDG